MKLVVRFRIRHPFFAALSATPAMATRRRCTALAGTFEELMEARRAGASASRAIYVLRQPECPFLGEREREALWEAFQVPTLAVLAEGHHLVGYECEAQAGYHLGTTPLEIMPPGAAFEYAPCECGRPGRRLRPASAQCTATATNESAQP